MKSLKIALFQTALLALAFGLFVSLPPSAVAADHRDAPTVDGIQEGDITDVYLFTDPNDSSRVVMIMNVNPFTVPAESGSYAFSPDLLYQFKIDNNGNARENLVIQITFDTTGQAQTATVVGPTRPRMTGARNVLVRDRHATVSGKFGTVFGDPNGVLAFAGLRDDSFGGFDVTSIAVSVPKSMIRGSGSRINMWATVSQRVSKSHVKVDPDHDG